MVDQGTNRQDKQKRILQFLERAPRHKSKTERKQIAEALVRAGSKYDDHVRHKQLSKPSERRNNFKMVVHHSKELVEILSSLDMIDKDDLEVRLGKDEFQITIVRITFLLCEASELYKTIQKRGRPRDEAKRRWIREVADIYENNFGKTASVWGPSAAKVKGPFYKLLEASSPDELPRFGALDPRTVTRVLKERSKDKLKMISLTGA